MNVQNNLEFKIFMKNIKKNNTIIEKRNKTRQEFRKRKEEREKKFQEVSKRNELNEINKKNIMYKRQMTKDLKDIQKRYQILKPEYDEDDLYYNNKDIKNKKIGNQINIYSNKRRQQLNNIKNKFYKKNQNLKIEQNNNLIDNLNKVDNELKNFEKQKYDINKKIIKNNNNNNIQTFHKTNTNNIQTFNKTKIDMIKNKYNNMNNENINNKNNIEIIGQKYMFKVIDNKLNEKNVKNVCFDGQIFEKFPDITQNKKQIKEQNKNNFMNNKNKKFNI